MKKLSQIDVEPLSDQRWSRIERSLFSRLELERDRPRDESLPPRRRPSARGWLVAAALLSVLGGAFLVVRALPERAVVEHPSRITTGTTGSHLALPGLSLDVEPQSAVVVSADTSQGMLIVVDRGGITCGVAPRAHEAPLVVQAGEARIRVVGTRFSVTRLGESARVDVREGVVEVSARGRTWQVRAGERWPDDAAEPARAEEGTQPSGAPTRTADEPAGTAPPQRPLSPSVGARAAPAAAATPRNAPRNEAPPASSPSPQDVFERATALERSDPGRAAELYRTLESGSDSWAQNALYAHGRLQASRGNGVEARRLLERYLERFPRGSNAEDARAVLRRLR